jgi:carbamoyl-phosphate synthase large subunit
MKNILITSPNNHVLVNTVYSLREAFYCKLIGLDKVKNNLSKHLLDHSILFNYSSEEEFVNKVKEICQEYSIDAIIPHHLKERLILIKKSSDINVPILSSSYTSIQFAENKINFAQACNDLGIPVPEQYVVNNFKDLKRYAKVLGYPEKKFIVKPVISKGGRGFRIVNDYLDLKSVFYSDKENNNQITMKGLIEILGDSFPDLIVSEYLPGKEYTMDCLREKDFFVAIPRLRIETKMGLTSYGKLEENKQLIEWSEKIAEKVGLTSIFGFQFKEDENGILKILECNPRIQGTMIMATLAGANLLELGLKSLWNKKIKEPEIDWDMEFLRVWGGISVGEKKLFLNVPLR